MKEAGGRHWRVPIVLAVLAVLCLVGAVDRVTRPLTGPFDAHAEEIVDGIAKRAAIAFGISRSINALISVTEGVTVSAGWFVEGSVAPGKALEPVNSLIGQFADFMLAVAVAAFILKLLLTLGSTWGISVVLAAALAFFVLESLSRGRKLLWKPRLERIGFALLLLAFILRIALPLAVFATDAISRQFLAAPYAEAENNLRLIQTKAQAASGVAEDAEDDGQGWIARNAALAKSIAAGTFAAISDSFHDAFNSVATMVTVFVFETMLLPVVLVWLLYRGFLTIARPTAFRTE